MYQVNLEMQILTFCLIAFLKKEILLETSWIYILIHVKLGISSY